MQIYVLLSKYYCKFMIVLTGIPEFNYSKLKPVTDICGYFSFAIHNIVVGLDYQVEEEEEQEGTSAYFKQGISQTWKSFLTTIVQQAL